jgi:hypothetical protein
MANHAGVTVPGVFLKEVLVFFISFFAKRMAG